MYHESVISLHVPVVQKKKTTIIIYFTSALPKFTGPENHIFVCFITWLQAIENALYKLLKGFSNGSRSNRPQIKSAPNQIGPGQIGPSQIGPSQIGPRSNHCIIMFFFLFNVFHFFFHTGKSHVRHLCCFLLSTCKGKYFLNSLDTIQQNI